MTREEAIKKLESLKISLPAAKDEISGIIKLIESPWISVKDDLPCNHEDLLIRDNKGYPQTKRVIVRYIEETLSGEKKYVRHVCCKMSPWDGTGKFRWHMGDECITHWMRIPELPKE